MAITVRRLEKTHASRPWPMCEASVGDVTKAWRDRSQAWARRAVKRGYKCECYATVSIDGVPYCHRHGGAMALRYLLGEDV